MTSYGHENGEKGRVKTVRVLRGEQRGKQIFYSALDMHIHCVIDDMVAHVGEPLDIEELD